MIWPVWCIFKRNAKHSNSEVCKYFASYFDLLWRSVADLKFATLLMIVVKNKNAFYSIPLYDNLWPLASLKKNLLLEPAFSTLEAYLWNTVSSYKTVLRQPQPLKVKRHDFYVFILDQWSSEEQKRLKLVFTTFFKDGAHYCYCKHFLRMPR